MEKTGLIHTMMRVYYHYQFVYKLVYYNNKTNNAAAAGFLPCRAHAQRRSAKKTLDSHFQNLACIVCLLARTCADAAAYAATCCSACKTTALPAKRLRDCGKADVYPQEWMCRTMTFQRLQKFVQVPFKRHTRFVRPVNLQTSP